MHTTVFAPSMPEVKSLIDSRLQDYCEARLGNAAAVHPRYSTLLQTMQTLLQAGGKRFRPYMVIMAYSAFSKQNTPFEHVLPAALAQELIHQAMLIHDDIIDRDTVRYGIPNITGSYEALYQPLLAHSELRHMAESSALLAGDILISDAYRMISTLEVPGEQISQAMAILSDGIFNVIGGELLDSEAGFMDAPIPAEIVARYKTASYSFESPLTIGAVLAGASTEQIQLLKQLAEYLGIGYQYRDDLLGVFGSSETTGKSTSTDIIEGKRTYLIEQFEMGATSEQKRTFNEAFHKSTASESQIIAARTALIESGAKQKVEETIDHLKSSSLTVIQLLDISQQSKEVFIDLVHKCLNREK